MEHIKIHIISYFKNIEYLSCKEAKDELSIPLGIKEKFSKIEELCYVPEWRSEGEKETMSGHKSLREAEIFCWSISQWRWYY